MSPTKFVALLICCIHFSNAAELEVKPTDSQSEAIATTKLTPGGEESKSKTEKRDSADQTVTMYTSEPAKEASFRPNYPSATYYEAAASGPIFEPTTLRYTAAEADRQSYYGKPDSGNIRFAPPIIAEHKQAAALGGLQGQLQYTQKKQQESALSTLTTPNRFSFAVPPQEELYQRNVPKMLAPQQQTSIHSYAEAAPSLYERAGPQQYQLGATTSTPQQQQLQLPFPGHRIQYIIAIPLSYMRQLQQQQQLGSSLLPTPSSTASSSTSTTSSTTTTTAAPQQQASHQLMQILGPLARDHQGQYRPYYHSDAENTPPVGPTPAAAYSQQYLQIPASVLLAAAQQLQQHHQQQQQQRLQTLYPKPTYQPLIYQPQHQPLPQPHQQVQMQRVYHQSPIIYAEQSAGQTDIYAFPLHQHQQQHQQQQQQQQQARLLRLGLKPTQQQHKYIATPSAATPSASTTTATLVVPTATSHEQQQHSALPIVHYNPIYVQAPAEQQQQQHQFAILPRFSNNNPKAGYNLAHESAPPIHVVRLSAVNALGHQQPQPISHYTQYHTVLQQQKQQQQQPQQQLYYQPQANFALERQQQQGAVSPAVLPYFSHPGAVHYGTHLYHPASGATTSTATISKQHQLQLQRQTTETTATSGRLPGDNVSGVNVGVGDKQPTASANIVKYP